LIYADKYSILKRLKKGKKMIALAHPRNMRLAMSCLKCGGIVRIDVNAYDLEKWFQGEYIQDAMPYLNADEREILISGHCGPCFDVLYSE